MVVEPAVQAEFERNLLWKRSWPRCFLAILGITEIFLSAAIGTTEVFNILVDFWYTNVFGGIWASIILLINWILIFVHVCCTTTITSSKVSLVWNMITMVALGTLIAFDILFIVNPYTCLLTPTCASQTPFVSIISTVRRIQIFSNYTIYDAKKFLLEIQIGCAGLGFLLTIMYIIVFIICWARFQYLIQLESKQKKKTTKENLNVAPVQSTRKRNPTVPSIYPALPT